MKKIIFLRNILLIYFILSKPVISLENDIYKKIDLFGEVLEKINKEYVEEINQSESMDSAINGLLQSLDPYSSYMSPEIFNEMQTETSGEFGGLGIEVTMESGVVKVISPIDDTPASRAGLKAGDSWCVCAERWKEAYEHGFAPKVYLKKTNKKTTSIIDIEILKEFAIDMN